MDRPRLPAPMLACHLMSYWRKSVFLCAALLCVLPAHAGPRLLTGSRLVLALQQGGYVLVMAHAHAPFTLPDTAMADPGNTAMERQLDDAGKAAARAMGQTLRDLNIAIGQVYCSPAFRARQTAALVDMGKAQPVSALDDDGSPDWLKTHAAEAPPPGKNTLIVTHMFNIGAAFPAGAKGLEDGGTLVLRPNGKEGATLVARIPIAQWRLLPLMP